MEKKTNKKKETLFTKTMMRTNLEIYKQSDEEIVREEKKITTNWKREKNQYRNE